MMASLTWRVAVVVQCLVDGPTTGVPRSVMNFKRIALTGITIKVARTTKSATLYACAITHTLSLLLSPCRSLPEPPTAIAADSRCLALCSKKKLEELETDIQSQFDATSWGTKLKSKKLRASLSDFGRFKVAIAKQKRNKEIAKKLATK